MLKILVNALFPFVMILFTPLGITESTPFGEALTIIAMAIGGTVIGWWMSRNPKSD